MVNTRNNNANGENNNAGKPATYAGASIDDVRPNAPNHATNNGQYATESVGTTATAKR
jgi:hypothetical protein